MPTSPAGALINPGEHVVVEIMLHAIDGSNLALYYHYPNSEFNWKGTVTGDYTRTLASDNFRETITEIVDQEFHLYVEDFEGDGTPTFAELGWTLGGVSNDWEIGTPAGLGGSYGNPDPVGAHSGSFSIGNDLTGLGTRPGDYENDTLVDSNWIYSPAIDCTGYSNVKLYFWQYLGVEQPLYDQCYIEASNDGLIWSQIWINPATIEDDEWRNVSFDISAVADNQATVYVRFEMGATDVGWEYCGWNIDDLMVTGTKQESNLEHKWMIDVPSGEAPYEFSLEANRPNSGDGDNFMFAFSTDDIFYTDMILVNSQGESVQTYSLPGDLSGTVYIRVVDTVRGLGNLDLSSVNIDEMFITSSAPSPIIIGYDGFDKPSYVEPKLTAGAALPHDIIVSDPGGPWPAWRFLSFPITANGNVASVLDDTFGDSGTTWDMVQWYDPLDTSDHWKSYNAYAPALSDMPSVSNRMGLWVHITANGGDGLLSCGLGDYPGSTTSIQLFSGWNLVGYPSATSRRADLTLPVQVTAMAVYNSAQPYDFTDVTDLTTVWMVEDEAYWVYTPSDVMWNVDP
jgi:hypothetical protein